MPLTTLHPEEPFWHPLAEVNEVSKQQQKELGLSDKDAKDSPVNPFGMASMAINALRYNPNNKKTEEFAASAALKVCPFVNLKPLFARVRNHEIKAMMELSSYIAHGIEKAFEQAFDEH